jgi:formyltetrahydrofolate deformylase
VVSNHLAYIADNYDMPFHHIPVTAVAKPEAVAQLTGLIAEQRADLVILARYRQVLFRSCARCSRDGWCSGD